MQDTPNVKNKAVFESMDSNLNGVTVEDIFRAKQNKITFCVYECGRFMNAGIENLDLSVRSYNCLRRAGHHTVGDIVNSISCGDDLKAIKSCGEKSIEEIMVKLFVFNYECLSSEMQKKCMAKLIELNGIKN